MIKTMPDGIHSTNLTACFTVPSAYPLAREIPDGPF